MTPDLFWIPIDTPGRLAIAARPRGGDWLAGEVAGWRRAGVTAVVSMLTPDEEAELGLTEEANACEAVSIAFIAVPLPDRSVPTARDGFEGVVRGLSLILRAEVSVAVHCRQGIGRSALFAIAVLKTLGLPTDEATRTATVARGRPVPETREQLAWLHRFTPAQLAATGTP